MSTRPMSNDLEPLVSYFQNLNIIRTQDFDAPSSIRTQHNTCLEIETASMAFEGDTEPQCGHLVDWEECGEEEHCHYLFVEHSTDDDPTSTEDPIAPNNTPNSLSLTSTHATLTDAAWTGFRISKPGPPPSYPLFSAALSETDTMFPQISYLIARIEAVLKHRGIPFSSITARNRYEQGEEPVNGDQTILIVGPEVYGWDVFLWDVTEFTDLFMLGLQWRVEFLTPEGEEFERLRGYQVEK
jgi:hypothetical protein